jgi:hypothetical protein
MILPLTGHDPNHLRILFGGDTDHGESYQEKLSDNLLTAKGYSYSLANLGMLMDMVDYRIINLETPLTHRHNSLLTTKRYLHYSDPIKSLTALQSYEQTAYSLANNHTLDQGPEGLADTVAALQSMGAAYFGAGSSLDDAAKPLLLRRAHWQLLTRSRI